VVFQTRRPSSIQESAEQLARRAVALDSGNAEAHSCLGEVFCLRADWEGGAAENERALAISPNLAYAYGLKGTILAFSGRPKEAPVFLHACMRFDPGDPLIFPRSLHVGSALYFCREYDAAVAAVTRAIRAYPDFTLSYRWLAAALGQSGRTAEAKAALEEALALAPSSFEMYVRHRPPWLRPEDHEHILEGLGKAGWQG
jgi:adenylate cyclase